MIVQRDTKNKASFIMTMSQHTAFSSAICDNFGNQQFAEIVNPDLQFVVANHDAGWTETDLKLEINQETGLPYHLTETPFPTIVNTMTRSPDFNTKHSDFSGLLSSMHSTGLLTGRYGLDKSPLIDKFSKPEQKVLIKIIHNELARQKTLKKKLKYHKDTIFSAYKSLQFFFFFSLYYNCQPAGIRGSKKISNVPTGNGNDKTIIIENLGYQNYSFAPYPFRKNGIKISFYGRWIKDNEKNKLNRDTFFNKEIAEQVVRFVD